MFRRYITISERPYKRFGQGSYDSQLEAKRSASQEAVDWLTENGFLAWSQHSFKKLKMNPSANDKSSVAPDVPFRDSAEIH